MSGIAEAVLFATTRIRTTFIDDIGNTKSGTGTGFWLDAKDLGAVLVTCRHNLDRSLWGDPEFQLSGFEFESRLDGTKPSSQGLEGVTPETEFRATVGLPEMFMSETADCAIIIAPHERCAEEKRAYRIHAMPAWQLAEESFFRRELRVTDNASFIGFAGSQGASWWDQEWNLPIARHCTLASHPGMPFKNSNIPTGDTLLVTGLSFSGSSGSPVISHERYFEPSIVERSIAQIEMRPEPQRVHRDPMVIGVMSGHWPDHKTRSDGPFPHSGLSYFTRSTSILELLAKARQVKAEL
jgi:hypothetical protein